MSNNIKNFIRQYTLQTAILLSTMVGSPKAEAQNSNSQSAQTEKLSQQTRSDLGDVPLFYDDTSLLLDQKNFTQILAEINVVPKSQLQLLKNYLKLKKSPSGITEKNFSWMVETAVIDGLITETQSQKIKNEALPEPSVYFSSENLLQALSQSSISADKQEAFIDAYLSLVDADLKITPTKLIKAFEAAKFNIKEADSFFASLINDQDSIPNQQSIHQHKKDLSHPTEGEEANTPFKEQEKSFKIENDQLSINYSFDENGTFKYNGVIKNLRVDKLLPPIYELDNGMLSCGPNQSHNERVLLRQETSQLRSLAIENQVYQDICKRQKNGENLIEPETSFLKKHPKKLEAHELTLDKNNRLVKKSQNTSQLLRSQQNSR